MMIIVAIWQASIQSQRNIFVLIGTVRKPLIALGSFSIRCLTKNAIKLFRTVDRTCSNHFEHLDMLLDHVKKHNNIIKKTRSTKRLRCSDCNKEFTRPDALKRHWKIHEKDKRIPCPFNKHTKCQRNSYKKPYYSLESSIWL